MKSIKRVLTVLIMFLVALSMTACNIIGGEVSNGQPQAGETNGGTNDQPQVEEIKGVTWPLKEKTTFTLMVINDLDVNEMAKDVKLLQELEEKTNVHIEFQTLPTDNTLNVLNGLFASGSEGDAFMQIALSVPEATQMQLLEDGKLIALEQYLTDPAICPNFVNNVLAESPVTLAHISSTDGHVITFPKYTNLKGNYIENPMRINKTWLDRLNLQVPTTITELEQVLIAFRDNDANGNGDPKDEIPMLFLDSDNRQHTEAFLYMYGLGTKNSKNDHNVHIVNGKVEYTPTTTAFKDGITTLNRFWNEGLVWKEAYTGNKDTLSATMNNDSKTPLFGVVWAQTLPSAFEDQYVYIPPISADGYTAEWWMNPGYLGAKGMAAITGKCKEPEVLATWFDLFYDREYGLRACYGEEGEYWRYDSEGKIDIFTRGDSEEDKAIFNRVLINLTRNVPAAFTAADYENVYAITGATLNKVNNFKNVESTVPKEFWPRPSMTVEIAQVVDEHYTDISTYANQKKAEWVTGKADINAEWDDYLKKMEKMGLADYIAALQSAYDLYMSAMK